jgi:hypothetical protein
MMSNSSREASKLDDFLLKRIIGKGAFGKVINQPLQVFICLCIGIPSLECAQQGALRHEDDQEGQTHRHIANSVALQRERDIELSN